MTNLEIMEALKKPFASKYIYWRVGSTNRDKSKGIALAYIDARGVMDRLDEVFGIDGWQSEAVEIKDGFSCKLTCCINGVWITKSDVANLSDIESIKGGFSDSLKRAAVSFGIGRYLYDLPNTWYPLKDGKYLPSNLTLPDWALPNEEKGKAPEVRQDYGSTQSQSQPSQKQGTTNPRPQTQELDLNPDTFTWGGGKHTGKKLADTPVDYLQWVVDKSKSPQPIKDMIAKFLSTNTGSLEDDQFEEFVS